MSHNARQEPEFDQWNDYDESDVDPDLDFEEDLDSYLKTQSDKIGVGRKHQNRSSKSKRNHLPSDWQDFDYTNDDWDNY
ncbi:MAG: hypothetical protein KTR32_06580 [Granulosicoccus sp.]|nr:hypothetical protein [Granulosicoccus sp.]